MGKHPAPWVYMSLLRNKDIYTVNKRILSDEPPAPEEVTVFSIPHNPPPIFWLASRKLSLFANANLKENNIFLFMKSILNPFPQTTNLHFENIFTKTIKIFINKGFIIKKNWKHCG